MFYYLYEIRNNLNGKIYVGVHKTKDMNDGYMGSGKVIRSAIQKHGISNFTKVILETFENAEAMYAREKEVVTDEFLMREDVYNLRRGGTGGFDYINNQLGMNNRLTSGYNASISPFAHPEKYSDIDIDEVRRKAKLGSSKKMKELHAQGKINVSYDSFGSKGNSVASRQKAAKTLKRTIQERGLNKGEKNSQYGTMWITNELENKKIKKTDVIPSGWRIGRVMPTPSLT